MYGRKIRKNLSRSEYILLKLEKVLQCEERSLAFSFCKSGNFTPGPSSTRSFCIKKGDSLTH